MSSLPPLRTVLTGAGTGIGRATAHRFSREGATLLLIGRRAEPLQEVAAETGAEFETLDVSEEGAMRKAVAAFAEKHGGLDALVANAGVNPQRENALDTHDDAWLEAMRINLQGTHRSCQAALEIMLKQEPIGEWDIPIPIRGSIVTVGSIAGLAGMKNRAAYGPSKAGIINYTQALAIDYGPQGIRANCVCPGFVKTDINRGWIENLPSEELSTITNRHALGMGTPEAVADAIYFLATRESRWITGVALPVDGGWRAS
ncbi:MAG: SDR family oxidoreductase [Planctomycetota bacterium]|nr:SDR family oxidoreductase [Planctomycetota bacterium]MDP6941311.1 SDR family oxidoreductase [Planctomycetota bacterium]